MAQVSDLCILITFTKMYMIHGMILILIFNLLIPRSSTAIYLAVPLMVF